MLGVTDKFLNFTDRIHLATTVELSEAALAVDAEAKKLWAGLSEEQLSWCPKPGRWSIAQNLAHLRTTTEVFLPAVDSALEASRIMGLRSEGPFVLSPFGRLDSLANGRAANYQDASAKDPSTAIAELTCFGVGAFSYLAGSHQAAHRGSRRFGPHRLAISVSFGQLLPCESAGVLFCFQRTFPAASLAG